MDMMFLMNMFDSNGDGRIGYAEFRNMLYYMGGQRQPMGMGMGMGMGMPMY